MDEEMTYTAFAGQSRIVSGPSGDAARDEGTHGARAERPILIFEDQTGRQVDFDFRGTPDEVVGARRLLDAWVRAVRGWGW
jgi:hypothetical protein